MQALHTLFCLGAIVSPLVTEPFLSKTFCVNSTTGDTSLRTTSGLVSAKLSFKKHIVISFCYKRMGQAAVSCNMSKRS